MAGGGDVGPSAQPTDYLLQTMIFAGTLGSVFQEYEVSIRNGDGVATCDGLSLVCM